MLKRTAFLRKPPEADRLTVTVLRSRKCKICYARYVSPSKIERWCSPECGYLVSQAEKAKKERIQEKARKSAVAAEKKADKKRKEDMQPPKYWKAKAKVAFHAYVRARDEGKPCASCDTILHKLGRYGGDYDAGHFRSVGLAKHLEFDPRNVWGQCKSCNGVQKRGNVHEYERRLRILKGNAFVDELLADNEPRHLKKHDFQAIEAHYKSELRALTNNT